MLRQGSLLLLVGVAAMLPGAAGFSGTTVPARLAPHLHAFSPVPLAASARSLPLRERGVRGPALRMSGRGMKGRGESGDEDEEVRGMLSEMPMGLYRSDNGTRDSEFGLAKADNPYKNYLQSLAPGEMVGQFMSTAPPRVQTAIKNTVLGLLGSLRSSPAFESNVVTTQRALASLMFQLEMTGYMFRNAEYRIGLQQSLSKALPAAPEKGPQISGKITVTLAEGKEVEVDAESYVEELRREVINLRKELVNIKQEREGDDLLAYVQKMEESEMKSLSGSISPEVLKAMRDLVDTVMEGMGGELAALLGPDSLTEVPASVLAQLCMWQLVVGYNLREIEAREELKKQLPGTDDK